MTAGIALAVPLLGGRFRFRFSATDAFVVVTITLVACSATHSLDRRPAINLAWEWVALGFVYLLLRNLPRTRHESSILAAALVATAVAVSAYGLYQNKVELPLIQAEFKRNPNQMLEKLNITPGTRGELMLRDRLLGSSEPWSTFALANSLAGYIAGPLVIILAVGLYNLVRPDAPGSRCDRPRHGRPARACHPRLPAPGQEPKRLRRRGCRSVRPRPAARKRVSPRTLLAIGLSGVLLVAGLVAAGLATRRLDSLVLTQSAKSLRTRISTGKAPGASSPVVPLLSRRHSGGPRSGGASGPAISPAPMSTTSCPRQAKRSSTPTTSSSKSGRRRASSPSPSCSLRWRWHSGTSSARRSRSTPFSRSIIRDASGCVAVTGNGKKNVPLCSPSTNWTISLQPAPAGSCSPQAPAGPWSSSLAGSTHFRQTSSRDGSSWAEAG